MDTNSVDFEELSSNLSKLILIDVRCREEASQEGQIPGSFCVPATTIKLAADLTQEEFKERYGFDKPSKEAPLVLYCKTGVRSKNAYEQLTALGFTNHRHYSGSLIDWQNNGGDVVKTQFGHMS
ncbi:unnamed protein product [Meganyctiphanes norvegica]|uniref:Rhodanese domain-containing protein n=1 Tax=Meganyctiphanes norvegica TaxID=48144 RepID=A0AAV2RLA4_MEGNR